MSQCIMSTLHINQYPIMLYYANSVEYTIGCVETRKHAVGLTLGLHAHIYVLDQRTFQIGTFINLDPYGI